MNKWLSLFYIGLFCLVLLALMDTIHDLLVLLIKPESNWLKYSISGISCFLVISFLIYCFWDSKKKYYRSLNND